MADGAQGPRSQERRGDEEGRHEEVIVSESNLTKLKGWPKGQPLLLSEVERIKLYTKRSRKPIGRPESSRAFSEAAR